MFTSCLADSMGAVSYHRRNPIVIAENSKTMNRVHLLKAVRYSVIVNSMSLDVRTFEVTNRGC